MYLYSDSSAKSFCIFALLPFLSPYLRLGETWVQLQKSVCIWRLWTSISSYQQVLESRFRRQSDLIRLHHQSSAQLLDAYPNETEYSQKPKGKTKLGNSCRSRQSGSHTTKLVETHSPKCRGTIISSITIIYQTTKNVARLSYRRLPSDIWEMIYCSTRETLLYFVVRWQNFVVHRPPKSWHMSYAVHRRTDSTKDRSKSYHQL